MCSPSVSSLASFCNGSYQSIASVSCQASTSFATTGKASSFFSKEMSEKWSKTTNDTVGIITSYLPRMQKVLEKCHRFEAVVRSSYSKALEVFKARIGQQNYSDISAVAVHGLQRVISPKKFPHQYEGISNNSPLIAKRIFCNLFKKIKLMKDGDGFLKKLFPNESKEKGPLLASSVIEYSINADILEKMYMWVEDRNLILMLNDIDEVRRVLDPNLLSKIDSASLEKVHARAESLREWLRAHNDELANVPWLYLIELTSLPSEIDQFVNLKSIGVGHNHFDHLPDSIGNLRNLESLWANNNHLEYLPDSIGKLVKLNSLAVYNNHLDHLPDSIGNLVNLESLMVDNNHLDHLPDSIGNLVKLNSLAVEHNHLEYLPDSIGNLVNLEMLWGNNNHLDHLPDSISNLRKLSLLMVKKNPLKNLPDMTNFPQNVRNAILRGAPLRAPISYYLSPYISSKRVILGSIVLIAAIAFTYFHGYFFSEST
jgi:hypothetical protein